MKLFLKIAALVALGVILGQFTDPATATMIPFAFAGLTGTDYNLDTLNQYKINRPGMGEAVRQRLYDFLLYPTAGQNQLTYFALQLGQGVTSSLGAVVASAKTYADTNMEVSGALPRPKSYLIESVEIVMEAGGSAAANTFTHATPNTFAAVAAPAPPQAIADVNRLRISARVEPLYGPQHLPL